MSNNEQDNDKEDCSIYSDDDIEACNVIVSECNGVHNIRPPHNDTNTIRIINYEHSPIARTTTYTDTNGEECIYEVRIVRMVL